MDRQILSTGHNLVVSKREQTEWQKHGIATVRGDSMQKEKVI